jgi:trehalose synthase
MCAVQTVQTVKVLPRSPGELFSVLTAEQVERFEAAAARAHTVLADRVVWNVSSTATGGGVAEMLHTLLGYVAGVGVQTGWAVIAGDAQFFAITKRLHNAIHGVGDAPALGTLDQEHYERTLQRNLPDLLELIRPQDLVLLHDPQPAGLLGPLRHAGIPAIWRCHIGLDEPNDQAQAAWRFLRHYIESADAFVFSRRQYAPDWVPAERLAVIPPSIDPLSLKNRPIPAAECIDILTRVGVLSTDGQTRSNVVQGGLPPTPDTRLVVQVSRWDRLKDMAGVMIGLSRLPAEAGDDVHLMLVGPAVTGVTDDPEGGEVLADCLATWRDLPPTVQDRVHLVSVPMEDPDENATIVNAVQRHATVVAQKSLAEGFGLTVAEAMWKAQPVVASAVGGIQDQIVDGENGLLVRDPRDLDAFARALSRPLADPGYARRLGTAAQARVRDQFLGDRHLRQYVDLFDAVRRGEPSTTATGV